MTKRKYARRLKRMLENTRDNCTQCPLTKQFESYVGSVVDAYPYTLEGQRREKELCGMCQSFVGLRYRQYKSVRGGCPCHRLNREQATERAWKEIRLYEKEIGIVL